MNFSVTTRLNRKDYTKIMYAGLYKKPVYIICTILGLYYLATVSLNYFNVINYYSSTSFSELFTSLFLLLFPSLIIMMSVYQFKSNPNFQNDITYTFSEDGILIQGTTFKSEISWAHIIKQKEIRGFLILYHTKKAGNFIAKSKLSPEQLIFIKAKIGKK